MKFKIKCEQISETHFYCEAADAAEAHRIFVAGNAMVCQHEVPRHVENVYVTSCLDLHPHVHEPVEEVPVTDPVVT